MAKSYFAILEVASNATAAEIHSAYRRLAKMFHPDHYEGGSERFQEIQNAYAVLSDPAGRKAHEKKMSAVPVRPAPVNRPHGQPEPLIPQSGDGGFDAISPVRPVEAVSSSFDRLFDRPWDEPSSFRASRAGRIQHLKLDIPLTREQALRGGRAQVMVPAQIACPRCRGYGTIGYYECCRCTGEGAVSGEVPLSLTFPVGMNKDHCVVIPLDRFGIRDLHLTVHFCPTDGG